MLWRRVINDNIHVVSFRNSDIYEPPYLGFKQNLLTTYQENNTNEMKQNCCFNLIKVKVKKYIYIKHKKTNYIYFAIMQGV